MNFVLIPSEAGMRHHKLTWIVIKILPSTYTITAISWPPPLISQLFHTSHFKQGRTFFLQPGCFWVDSTYRHLNRDLINKINQFTCNSQNSNLSTVQRVMCARSKFLRNLWIKVRLAKFLLEERNYYIFEWIKFGPSILLAQYLVKIGFVSC